jgi:cold shock CspA family protein
MATYGKKERENKKKQKKKEKEEKKQERKDSAGSSKSLEDMMAYLDENGNIVSKPPDPSKKRNINAEDIEIGIPKRLDPEPGELIRTGVISFFNSTKGFGFIKDLITGDSIFVHQNAAAIRLAENMRVTFEVEKGPKGLNAVNVEIGKT